ncbi:MAG: Dps family protein [Parachlamydiales bacterium]
MGSIAEGVSQFLADTFVLYTKTLNFHWNVVDRRFAMLHALFEEHYKELASANDDLAEQVRQLGAFPPSTLAEFLKKTQLKEPSGRLSGDEMIRHLVTDHEALAKKLPLLIQHCTEAGEEGCGDLLIERLRFHQKAAWMLRSHLE